MTQAAALPLAPAAWPRSDRSGWLVRVEDLTAEHREARAVRCDRRAAKARRAGDELGARYWSGRADGQRERFARVRDCAKKLGTITSTCRSCGSVHELPVRCDSTWFCPACRNETKKAQRKRFLLARDAATDVASRMGLYRRIRRGGRFGDKFLTFTVPHRGFDERTGEFFVVSAEDRVRMRDEAFPKLMRSLRRYWADVCGSRVARHISWQRRYEWTPGDDGLGHPHVHLWALSPYVPKALLHEWWFRALAAVGWRGGRKILYPDIIPAYGADVARELVKYLVKDLVSGGIVSPEAYAEAYKLHDGKRRTQSSRGFMARIPKLAPCSHCHDAAGHNVEVDRGAVDLFARPEKSNVIPLKRGPPLQEASNNGH